jgi:hypothetical protein
MHAIHTLVSMRLNPVVRDHFLKQVARLGGPWDDWVRLKYEMTDYWTGEPLAIDDKIFLATSRPPFGGLRWWFVCPHLNRRVRKLYLPRILRGGPVTPAISQQPQQQRRSSRR